MNKMISVFLINSHFFVDKSLSVSPQRRGEIKEIYVRQLLGAPASNAADGTDISLKYCTYGTSLCISTTGVCFLRPPIRMSENRRALLRWIRSRSLTNTDPQKLVITQTSLPLSPLLVMPSKIRCVINRSSGREQKNRFP